MAEQTDPEPRKGKKSSFGLSQRNQYIVVGALAAFFVGLLLHQGLAGDEEAAAAPVELAQNEPAPLPPPPAVPPLPDEPVMPDPVQELARDPFALPARIRRRLDKQAPTDEGGLTIPTGPDPEIIREANALLVVKGIMGRPGNRMAFINNRPIRAGGTIAGFTVMEVRERSVLLKKEETEVELELQSVPEGGESDGS